MNMFCCQPVADWMGRNDSFYWLVLVLIFKSGKVEYPPVMFIWFLNETSSNNRGSPLFSLLFLIGFIGSGGSKGSGPETHNLLSVQILSFSCSFRQKIWKIIGWRICLTEMLDPPLIGSIWQNQGCACFAVLCANSCAPWLLFSEHYNGSVKTCLVKNSQNSPKFHGKFHGLSSEAALLNLRFWVRSPPLRFG